MRIRSAILLAFVLCYSLQLIATKPAVPIHILGNIPNRTQKLELRTDIIPPSNCKELCALGIQSGQNTLNLGDNEGEFEVYCDMDVQHLLGGGWTVIQRRVSGDDPDLFYKKWKAYKTGFGTFQASFWLGLEKIHRLTASDNYELYIGMSDASGDEAWTKYSTFRVGDEASQYTLTVAGYSGTAGDSLSYHNGSKFSTTDRDNDSHSDRHCSQRYGGGWWFKNCHQTNLNGRYYENGLASNLDGISWQEWKIITVSLKTVVMAIRPKEH